MSSREITLIREASFSLIASGGWANSRSSPSIAAAGSGRTSRRARSAGPRRRRWMASSRIFCRNFTTGASSTSAARVAGWPAASSVAARSSVEAVVDQLCQLLRPRSAEPLDELDQLVVLDDDRVDRGIAVWNLIRSSVCRSVGSEIATEIRLPRLPSATTRVSVASLRSIRSPGSWSTSTAVEVEQRVAEGLGREAARAGAPSDARRAISSSMNDLGGVGLLLDRQRLVRAQQAVLHERARQPGEDCLLRRLRRCRGATAILGSESCSAPMPVRRPSCVVPGRRESRPAVSVLTSGGAAPDERRERSVFGHRGLREASRQRAGQPSTGPRR